MSTWDGRSSRDRFGSWATTQNSGVGWFAAQPKLSQQTGSQSGLASRDTAGNARAARRCRDALGLDERAQHRQRQIGVANLDRPVEPVGKLALARQGAIPFALVIGDAANLPQRQFQIDQRQRGIDPGFRSDQAFDPRGFFALSESTESAGTPPRTMSDISSAVSALALRSRSPISSGS